MDDQDKTDPGMGKAGQGDEKRINPQFRGPSVSNELAAVTWKKPEIGDVIGSYRVVDFIGGGGMALIYRAQHVRLGREVALKVLRPQLANQSDQVLRFFEEARAVNEIQHPNIVEVVDFVEDGAVYPPLVYMVMELLSGQDLHTRIYTPPPLEPGAVIEIALQVLGALKTVHQNNVLHRDLKPSNIFLVEQSSSALRVKVLDFGLVKAFGDRAGHDLTSPNVLVGTPEFMAPEQILGGDLDQRTDLYTMGLVLYEMVSGRRPFTGDRGQVLVKQAKDSAPPFTHADSSVLERSLEAVALRCLEKDPKRRYQTAGEVMAALSEIQVSRPQAVATEEVNMGRGLWRWTLALGGVLLLVVAAVLLWLMDHPGTSSAKQDQAKLPRVDSALPLTAAVWRDARPDQEQLQDGRLSPDRPHLASPQRSKEPLLQENPLEQKKILRLKKAAPTSSLSPKPGSPPPKKSIGEGTVDPFSD